MGNISVVNCTSTPKSKTSDSKSTEACSNLSVDQYFTVSRGTLYTIKFSIKLFTLNSVVLVRKRTILTERPQPAGEVSANLS
jgi:hypothetical protein